MSTFDEESYDGRRYHTDDLTVAIHQPNYLPWLGYFHKIHRSDVFVFLDTVEYTSNSWINRNKIKTPDGWTWLTVPVRGSSGPIADAEIADDGWRNSHEKSLQQNYGKAAYFDDVIDLFEQTYAQSWESLCELNIHLVRSLADRLGLECRFVRSSDLDVDATRSERIVGLCDELGADRYFSGTGARSYNDRTQFEAAGIALEYQSIDHPQYEQRFGDFVPNLSIVDALMNLGADGTYDLLHSITDHE
ncbi:WbqC family protein [Haloterrigena sp. SYSU A558-1]|uniref:WbqC family protein n=1 Tax=Haloterrigena gelatinilytica TaxID=2741724 RepID=A0ABX2LI49_9EURY|nr:WbqC family protein [Haloterrigena gelatinilytica]NUC72779.1 WbqC family protein [Haloterrigena gelatinilytica]